MTAVFDCCSGRSRRWLYTTVTLSGNIDCYFEDR